MMRTLALTLKIGFPKRLRDTDTDLKLTKVCQLCARDGELDPDCPYCELLREYTLTNEDFADMVQLPFHGTNKDNVTRNIREAKRFE